MPLSIATPIARVARASASSSARSRRGERAFSRRLARTRASTDDDAEELAEREPSRPRRKPSPVYDGGKYGMGKRIDDALDATTNQDTFVLGGFVFTISAAMLYLFGPRPPTDY